MWVDAHAHLHTSQFDGDRLGTIARARDAGVVAIIETVGDLTGENVWRLLAVEPAAEVGAPGARGPVLR